MDDRPIVVGCEGSEGDRDAVALARVLAGLTGAPIEVVCVHPYAPLASRIGGGRFEDAAPPDAEATLAGARAELADVPGVLFRSQAASTPALGLELAVAEADAAILVLGSTHHGGLGRVLPGSTGQQALARVSCAVAVAPLGYDKRARARAPTVIGVAYDGSDESAAALRYGVALAAGGAAIRLIGAFDATLHLSDPAAPLYGMPSYLGEIRLGARQALEQAAAAVPGGAQSELLEGSPAICLSRASQGVDLLLLGSHRQGPLRRIMLGSVSSRLIDHVACPVLVLSRSSAPRPAAGGAHSGPLASA